MALSRLHSPDSRGFASGQLRRLCTPRCFEAIALASTEATRSPARREDVYTEHLQEVFRRALLGARAEAFPMFNGTGANVVALQAMTGTAGRP